MGRVLLNGLCRREGDELCLEGLVKLSEERDGVAIEPLGQEGNRETMPVVEWRGLEKG